MRLTVHRLYNNELNFQKQNYNLSVFRFRENLEAYTSAAEVNATRDEVKEFVQYAVMPQEMLESVDEVPLDRVYSIRFRAKVLCAIAQFNSTFIAKKQLSEYLSMKDNKLVSDYSLTKALETLTVLGFIETVKVKAKNAENSLLNLYKLSSVRMKDGTMQKVLATRLSQEEIKEIVIHSGLRLRAENVLRNNIVSSIILELFKNQFIFDAVLPGEFDSEREKANICAYVNIKSPMEISKRLYIFAPRNAPGNEQFIKDSVKAFAVAHESDDVLPKLLLCCEDADSIFDLNDLLEEFRDDVQFVFTDDLSVSNDIASAFSVFDENGTELQLSFIPFAAKPQAKENQAKKESQSKKPTQKRGGKGNGKKASH